MWTIFKVFIDLLQHCFCFIFDFGMWQSGIEPAPPASEGKVLTSGLPGKSLVTARFVGSWLFAGSAKIS